MVVTGGTKGIGRATVARFLGLGDRVVALGRDPRALSDLATETEGGQGSLDPIACDVSDEAAVDACFGQIGPVDVLVNNAGIGESAPLSRTSLEDWRRHLAVNATGPFLCTRAVLDGMRERGSGAIVTVASTAGRAGFPYTAAYSASKHAAIGLMRATAAELAGTGVRANALCPTFVATPMTERSIANIAQKTGRDLEQSARALEQSSPLGRLLDPDEVAQAVVWLASPETAAINGQALVIDGGGIQA